MRTMDSDADITIDGKPVKKITRVGRRQKEVALQIDLSGRIAVVTGASRRVGIGAAVAHTQAAAGADIFVTYFRPYDASMPWGAATMKSKRCSPNCALGCVLRHGGQPAQPSGPARHGCGERVARTPAIPPSTMPASPSRATSCTLTPTNSTATMPSTRARRCCSARSSCAAGRVNGAGASSVYLPARAIAPCRARSPAS